MLDLFHLPPSGSSEVQFFYRTSGTNDWATYTIPRGRSMVLIIGIGGGGGGGGGHSAAAGNARGGGGGGASGGVSRVLIPRIFLPDTIFIQPGLGGAGGAATADGTTGNNTYVSIAPSISAAFLLMNVGAGTGGSKGTGAAGGAAGFAASSETANFGIIRNLGLWVAIGGQAGSAGGAHTGAAGGSVAWTGGGAPTSGGTGGGGTGTGNSDNAGGSLNGIPIAPTTSSTFNLSPGAAAAGAGSNGHRRMQPFVMSGGTGGGTAGAAGTAGAGGNGEYGSGGGGGGGGVTGGAGGRGGDGLVIIASW